MIKLRGLNAAEYEAVKADVKKLGFKATVRQWKRQYAYGAIDIRPVKANEYSFTKDQLDELYKLMKKHGLHSGTENYFETVPHYDIIYRSGLCFLYKVC